MYQIAVVLIVALHLAFLGYGVFGGFLALRRPRTFWLHVPVVAWGLLLVTARLDCPLTGLERWAREQAGWPPLPPDGFIAHYLTGVLYPASWTLGVQVLAAAVVTVSWALYGRERLRHRRYGGSCAGPDHR